MRTCVPPFEYIRPNQLAEFAQVPAWISFAKKVSDQAQPKRRPGCRLVLLAQSNHGTGGDSSPWLGTSAFTFAFSPDREKWKNVRLKPSDLPGGRRWFPYAAQQAISIAARPKGQSAWSFWQVARSYLTSSITASWQAITTASPGRWFRSARASGDT
jgi:hypothetical protein